ncbi:OsmC family protein [Desulfosarcina sp. OttesenSCG-928-A07]|nr:OsmC family protein [Desulfosarcina sp. OttesenSCG-928-A07]
MEIEISVKWAGDLQFVGRSENGPAVVLDSPDGGSGPNPMQLVLMGTAGCTAMDVISILKKKRMAVTGFSVNMTGRMADTHPMRYTHIHVEYVIFGKDINPAGVEQAISLSKEKYCSAMASLNAEITQSFRVEDA